MSAPDTNVRKQEKQHKAPLWGMGLGVGFAAILFIGWLFMTVGEGTQPTTPETRMDDFTGESVQTNPDAAVESDAETMSAVPAGSD